MEKWLSPNRDESHDQWIKYPMLNMKYIIWIHIGAYSSAGISI